MSLSSLGGVLGNLEQQYTTPDRKQYERLLRHWEEIVGGHVAVQTRPIAIRRGVLNVATASAAWSQNLAFERQRILTKLNDKLALSLTDIRFSTAQWHTTRVRSEPETDGPMQVWQQHPSRLKVELKTSRTHFVTDAQDSQQAFAQWEKLMRSRTQHLTQCPQCQCPTPPGELERWGICSLCAAKTMGNKLGNSALLGKTAPLGESAPKKISHPQ
jgi:predicted nucleic acid-binding Zn ribbon protein